jgi:hypothetical protein
MGYVGKIGRSKYKGVVYTDRSVVYEERGKKPADRVPVKLPPPVRVPPPPTQSNAPKQ